MITWTDYLLWLCVLLVVYYAIVLLFFRAKGGAIKMRKKRVAEKKAVDSLLFKEKDSKPESQDAVTMAPVHSLVDELQAMVSQAGKDGMGKVALFNNVKMILKKYPGTKGSIYQNGITNLVEVIAESNCGVQFNGDELSALWDDD